MTADFPEKRREKNEKCDEKFLNDVREKLYRNVCLKKIVEKLPKWQVNDIFSCK